MIHRYLYHKWLIRNIWFLKSPVKSGSFLATPSLGCEFVAAIFSFSSRETSPMFLNFKQKLPPRESEALKPSFILTSFIYLELTNTIIGWLFLFLFFFLFLFLLQTNNFFNVKVISEPVEKCWMIFHVVRYRRKV